MTFWIRRITTIVLLLISSNGCLVLRSRNHVIRENEARRVMRFQSVGAQRQFQAHSLDAKARRKTGSRRFFAIPFVVFNNESSVLSENAYYNDEAARCDTNGDGLLSDFEVAEYSSSKAKDVQESENAAPPEVAKAKQRSISISFRAPVLAGMPREPAKPTAAKRPLAEETVNR